MEIHVHWKTRNTGGSYSHPLDKCKQRKTFASVSCSIVTLTGPYLLRGSKWDPYHLGLAEKQLTDAHLLLEDPIVAADVARCNPTSSKPLSISFRSGENSKRASTHCSALVEIPGAVPPAPSHRKVVPRASPTEAPNNTRMPRIIAAAILPRRLHSYFAHVQYLPWRPIQTTSADEFINQIPVLRLGSGHERHTKYLSRRRWTYFYSFN